MRYLQRSIATLALFAVASWLFANSPSRLDSLKNVLDQEAPYWTPEDLIPLFLDLGKAYIDSGDPDNALNTLDQGINLSTANKMFGLLQELRLEKGRAYLKKDMVEDARVLFQECLTGSSQEQSLSEAQAHQYLSEIFFLRGAFDDAYRHAIDNLLIREKRQDTLAMSAALIQIGDIHFEQDNFRLALRKYDSALDLQKGMSNEESLLPLYTALARVHKKLGRKDKALRYNKKALAIADKLKDRQGIAEGKANNAELYIQLGLYEAAVQEYEDANLIFEDFDDRQGQVKSNTGIGKAYLLAGDPDQALYFLDEASCLAESSTEERQQLS
ncbi:MAG: tetratricopeptide repeat protein, partial [Saprospiraceae bacterium]|nr:tetratricopeptide repeat protein [Saprospiraceae bacterium]